MAAVTRGGTRLGSGCVLVVHATASNSDVSWCKLGSSWVLITSSNKLGSSWVLVTFSNGWPSGGSCATVECRMLSVEVGLWARRPWWMRARSEMAALRDPCWGLGSVEDVSDMMTFAVTTVSGNLRTCKPSHYNMRTCRL
jgi:hypothetical protein